MIRRIIFVALAALIGLSSGQIRVNVRGRNVDAADFTCPEEFGYYPHPTDCTRYYVCVFGGALLESCTGSLVYSRELQTCDWARNVDCLPETNANRSAVAAPHSDFVNRRPVGPQPQLLSTKTQGFTSTETASFQHKPLPAAPSTPQNKPGQIHLPLELLDEDFTLEDINNANRQGRVFASGQRGPNPVIPQRETSNVKTNDLQFKSTGSAGNDFVQPTTFRPAPPAARFDVRPPLPQLQQEQPESIRNPDNRFQQPQQSFSFADWDSRHQQFRQHQNVVPEQPSRVPEQQFRVPEQPSRVPEQQQFRLPEQPSRVPEQQFRVPEQPSRAPEQQFRVPEQPQRVPEQPSRVPEQQFRVPEQPSRVPEQQFRVPEQPSRVPEQQFRVPQAPVRVPEEQFLAQEEPITDVPELQVVPVTNKPRVPERQQNFQQAEEFQNYDTEDFHEDVGQTDYGLTTFHHGFQSITDDDEQFTQFTERFPERTTTPFSAPRTTTAEPTTRRTTPTTTTTTTTPTTTTTTTTTTKPPTVSSRSRTRTTTQRSSGRGSSKFRGQQENLATSDDDAVEEVQPTTSTKRGRPQKGSSSSEAPASSKTELVDISRFPPRRLDPVFPQPVADEAAAKCNADVCRLPDCYCGGKDIPGGFKLKDTPQIVLLTFDDSVNDLNRELYRDIFEKDRTNPNGCPIVGTFYVSHEWTDYSQVQNLYASGHEIASHTISHSFGEQFSSKKWAKEAAGQRDILAAFSGVKPEDVRGLRAPFLSIGGNRMFKMLYDMNFTYDSSMPVYENKPPSWPYTLDYKIFHDCMIPPCPTKSYPGVWEVPMVMWQDLSGGRCSMGDGCANPPDAEGIYKMLIKNFERHYTTNRAPFPLFYHAAWFTTPHHKEGFEAFLDTITSMEDVWVVTNWQAIQWVRDPTPLDRVKNFKPFGCDYSDRPKKCTNPKVCNAWHKSGVRYMKTCQPCPEVYPWTGRTGVRNLPLDQYVANES